MDHISRPTEEMASVRRMPGLPRQGMGCGCAARPRSLEGAGIASLSNLRRKRPGIPIKNFRRQPCRDAVERANDKIRPIRPKEHLDGPEGGDREPQSCGAPRWTKVGGERPTILITTTSN